MQADKTREILLIEKLAMRTTNGQIKWNRLYNSDYSHENKLLQSYIEDYHMSNYSQFKIDMLSSYYTKIKNGYVFIFTLTQTDSQLSSHTKTNMLAVQSRRDTRVVEIHGKGEFQSELARIINLIERQIDGVDSFIEEIINYTD